MMPAAASARPVLYFPTLPVDNRQALLVGFHWWALPPFDSYCRAQ